MEESLEAELERLITKYGPDFFMKLPKYKTAYLGDKPVKILDVFLQSQEAYVVDVDGVHTHCSINELDNFVL